MMGLGRLCDGIGYCCGTTIKLNSFGVRMLTMHRWFNISAAETDLKYEPVIGFEEGWQETIAWFKANWLPKFISEGDSSVTGLHSRTQERIDTQTTLLNDTNTTTGK